MRGNFRLSSLADVLRHLYAERKSGVLHLTREGIQRRVHFRKGVPIFAEAADSPLPSRDQAESLLYSLFTWTSGEFSFEELEPQVDEGRAFTASPSVMILEGSRRIAERGILEHLICGSDSVFACAQSSVLPLFTMKLSPPESAILKLARERERFTARDLPFPSGALEVVRSLNALVSVGLLEVVEKASVPLRSPAALPPARSPAPEPAEPVPPIPAPPHRGDVQNVLDTFQAKRHAVPTLPSKPRLPVSPPPPAVEAAVAPAEPAPPRVEREADLSRALEVVPSPVTLPPLVPPALEPAEPPPAIPVPPHRSDVQNILDTFQAKRHAVPTLPSKPRLPVSPPPPAVDAAVAPAEPAPPRVEREADLSRALEVGPSPVTLPPAVAPALEPAEPPPAIPVPPHRGDVQNILDTFQAKRHAVPTLPSKPRPRVSAPPPAVDAAVAPAEPAPPRVERKAHPVEIPPTPVSRGIPASRRSWILGASLAIAAIAVLLGLSLSLRRDDTTRSDAVVAFDSAPSEPEPVATALPSENPEGPPDTHTEPSDTELLDSANLAFEGGDYERSKAELTALLERQPDLAAARELMARVERELTSKPRVAEETRASKKAVEKPSTPDHAPAAAPPDPAKLFEAARSAFARSDLETAQAQLDALEAVHASYPGAWRLREELALRFWEGTLPLAFNVRHDHALGNCTGVLQLTSSGFSYRSKEHEWVWSFAEVTDTERRDPSRLRIGTKGHTNYNFAFQERPSDDDWARHQALRQRY